MTSTLEQPAPAGHVPARHPLARFGLLTHLEHPRQVFGSVTPNWYASIMGTGIVATAAASLPLQFTGLRAFATVVWAAAALPLVGLTAVTLLHWRRHRETASGHHLDPVMAHFYGAPPMAMLTVGAGTLLLGKDIFGLRAAVGIDWALWLAGTLTGLIAAFAVPYLQFTRHEGVDERSAFGGWLMPVVPPMVSASTGALLVPYAPAGQARLTLLLCCYAMFGLALIASLVIITLIWQRLALHKAGPARMVPTLWIMLGPLGQSITAANLLGGVAAQAVLHRPAGVRRGVRGARLGLRGAMGALAAAITFRTARRGLPFSLTWWSFTFPVGTCVTGTSGLSCPTFLGQESGGYFTLLPGYSDTRPEPPAGSCIRVPSGDESYCTGVLSTAQCPPVPFFE